MGRFGALPLGELVKRDVHGRVRHAIAFEPKVHNADPAHCKGVWKPAPDKYVNESSALGMAGGVQRARARAIKNAGGKQPIEPTPIPAGKCERLGHQHQANVREIRELQAKKMDAPRPATVPAMNVEPPWHVGRYFDRAADHGEMAQGYRTERHQRPDSRPHDARTVRAGHTQHRTACDVDARMNDVWGAMHQQRGVKAGQLAGSNYINRAPAGIIKVYFGNVGPKVGIDEIKEACGLRKEEILMQDPSKSEASGLFTIQRKAGEHFAVLTTHDAKFAKRVVNYCKSRPLKLHGRALRVDIQQARDCNMQWTGITDTDHRPEGGDWFFEHKQSGASGKAYGMYESEHKKQFSAGLQYDLNGVARYLHKHPAGNKAYPSVAEGRRRGAVKHGFVQWYPWMPAWEKGAPLKRMDWLPTPEFPGGEEGVRPMSNTEMRAKWKKEVRGA